MVLKTFGMPTAVIQAGIAKTKMVLNTLRRKVSAVRESPTISVSESVSATFAEINLQIFKPTVISIEHIRQGQAL
jgi:hypothetical protein